ncbi:MAG: XRE family transcriptional regulator [Oscillospiraceae bacterium]|nr:XRE family transcriptional regulator [Oscillospiraceae bacterium]
MQVNIEKLRGKMAENSTSGTELAKAIGMDESTFYRKMKAKGLAFTIAQMHNIVDKLNLTDEEAISIFLADNSHKCEKSTNGQLQ